MTVQQQAALDLERRHNRILRDALVEVEQHLDEWPHLITATDGTEYDLASLYLVVRTALVKVGER